MRVIRFSEGNLREILGNLTGLTFIREQSGGSEAETQKLLLLTSSVSELGGRGGRKVNNYHDSYYYYVPYRDGKWQIK